MNAIVVLEVMWDWRSRTTRAGYTEQAPPWFVINPQNFTGSRLYDWLGYDWHGTVTNACQEVVSSADQRGTPDPGWLGANLETLIRSRKPKLLLVCGNVAQKTYQRIKPELPMDGTRLVLTPHPAARGWTIEGLKRTKHHLLNGERSLRISLSKQARYGIKVEYL